MKRIACLLVVGLMLNMADSASAQGADTPDQQGATPNVEAPEEISKPARKLIRRGQFEMPERAKAEDMHGTVVLSYDVLADGTVGNVIVTQSSGHPILDEATIAYVSQRGFSPLEDGEEGSVETRSITIPIPPWSSRVPLIGELGTYSCSEFVARNARLVAENPEVSWREDKFFEKIVGRLAAEAMQQGKGMDYLRSKKFQARLDALVAAWPVTMEQCKDSPDAVFYDVLMDEQKRQKKLLKSRR